MVEKAEQILTALLFALVGGLIGWGQSWASPDVEPRRVVVGRSVATGGLAMAAGTVLIWVPGLPLLGLLGVAALLASLGTAGLERAFKFVIQRRAG